MLRRQDLTSPSRQDKNAGNSGDLVKHTVYVTLFNHLARNGKKAHIIEAHGGKGIPDTAESSNFLEVVHIQAYYFQVRWFPRLRWFTLRPPAGQFFIIGDRCRLGECQTPSMPRRAACATKQPFS